MPVTAAEWGLSVPRDNPDKVSKDLLPALEKLGWEWLRIRAAVQNGSKRGKGIPDTIIAKKGIRHPRLHLLEIKTPGARGLSEDQKAFVTWWPTCVHMARNAWEANLLLTECEGRK